MDNPIKKQSKKMETKTVQMTAQEEAEFKAYQADKEKKASQEKAKADRAAYAALVDETIEASIPLLEEVSNRIAQTKQDVLDKFKTALELKATLFKTKEEQFTHTFTNSDGSKRIMVGYRTVDDYRDTVQDGITMVYESLEGLAKDEDSRALVNAVNKLLARDAKGTLKASRVLQLQELAEDRQNERMLEGVRIIRESYQPSTTKRFISAQVRGENNEWKNIPLGMTEA